MTPQNSSDNKLKQLKVNNLVFLVGNHTGFLTNEKLAIAI